ncbi:MAG: hypothetical protein GWP60_11850 [Gammaproteobacteria bacterium]|jgi:hypothetical protein|nr:hypothetical protein [Gammaproteobacteria bacterium]
MTHFEYIAVAVSIILGLGVIQLLSNLDRVLAQPRRYWLHSAWVFMLFWILVQNWWAFWDLKDIAWNLGYFSLWVTYVSALYLTVLALTKTNSAEVSWEEVYFSRTRRFFGLFGFVVILAVLLTWITLDASLLHPYRYMQYTSIAIFALLFASKRKRLHEVLSILVITFVILSQVIFRLQPGLFENAG